MKRQLWMNLGLTALAAALGWLVFFKSEAPNDLTQHRLSTLSATQIDRISITPANRSSIELRKRQNTWYITQPLQARADAVRVENLLGLLTAQSEKRLPATELARFGLDKPLARVQLGNQEFFFGATQPLSNQLYVQTQGAVFLISPVYFVDAVKPAQDFISKRLLADDEIPVAFEFANFTLTRDQGTWRMTPPASASDAAPTQDAANAFADEWRHGLASSVQVAETPQASQLVQVKFQSGKSIRVIVARDAEDWLLLREDERLVYRFSAKAGSNLLEPTFAPSP